MTSVVPELPPAPPARRPRRRGPMLVALIIATVIHLPLTPLVPLFRILRRVSILRDSTHEWDYKPSEPDLSVELVDLPKPEPVPTGPDNAVTLPDPAAAPTPTAPRSPPASKAPKDDPASARADQARAEREKKEREKKEAAKAGTSLPGGAPGALPGADQDAPDEAAEPGKEASGDAAPDPTKAPPSKAPKAVGITGDLGDKAGKPNVTLALWLTAVRGHPLGDSVGKILACEPDWKPFLARGIKPLEDLDGFLAAGPQLGNGAKMIYAARHRLSPERLHDALDALVQTSGKGGQWLGSDAARVLVQRRDRVVFSHERDMIFVTPPSLWKSMHDVKGPLSLPAAKGRAASLTLRTPALPLHKLGLTLPARLSEMRLDVFGNRDGSIDLQIEFDDDTPDSARADAPEVNRALGPFFSDLSQLAETVTSITPGAGGGDPLTLPPVEFVPVEKRLTATVRVPTAESGRLLGVLSGMLCPKAKTPGGH